MDSIPPENNQTFHSSGMAAAVRNGGGIGLCTRTKPEIYKTEDGKLIVEDEFLNFLVVKMRTLSHDEIVLLASSNFSSEWIEESKKLLFEVCPTNTRCITHRGLQKDINNIKACLTVLNQCGENIPRFVSHYLDELPPVGFGHMDISALLSRMERLSMEVSSMRGVLEMQQGVLEMQTGMSEALRAARADVERRMTAVEQQGSAEVEQRGDVGEPLDGEMRLEHMVHDAQSTRPAMSSTSREQSPHLSSSLWITVGKP